jgi:glycosyltransferase involved in cell wall biosynthesis
VLVDNRSVLAAGLVIVGSASVVVAKVAFETHSDSGAQTTQAATELLELRRHVHRQQAGLADLRATAAVHTNALDRLADVPRWRAETEQRELQLSRHVDQRIGFLMDALGESAATTHAAVSRLRRRLPTHDARAGLAGIESDVVAPLLTIAIPSFNRPDELTACLDSVAREVLAHGNDAVEVCITDDASTDPDALETAAQFAMKHGFAALRVNPENVGLERNLLESVRSCRGRYVLILGNDDMLCPDALHTVVADLSSEGTPPLWVYEKLRVNQDGDAVPPVPGSTPIELATGESCRFGSFIEAAGGQGLLSTFGFISQVVFERAPFRAVDEAPFLDLTMYPQVFVMAQAFASTVVGYRNHPIVFHRTPTHARKFAESLGRREQSFMAGGRLRASRYFGSTYAASLQRAIDRGALRFEDVIQLPERLMGSGSVVDWIDANRSGAEIPTLPSDVIVDADRFFSAVHSAREANLESRPVRARATSDRRDGERL